MKVLLSFVALSLVGTLFAKTPFQLCDNMESITVTDIALPGCDGPPCKVTRGTNVSVTISFKTKNANKVLQNKVYGIIGGVKVPFPGYPENEVDACKLGTTCPTKADGANTEKVMLPVSKSFPKLSVTAKWEIFCDDSGPTIECGCFEVPLQLED